MRRAFESAASRRAGLRVGYILLSSSHSSTPSYLQIDAWDWRLRDWQPMPYEPPSFSSFPRTCAIRGASSAVCFWGSKMRFFRLLESISFFACIFDRKNDENHGFWPPETLPKPFQNASQIALSKNMRFFIDFFADFLLFLTSDFLKIVIFPGENHYFWRFR